MESGPEASALAVALTAGELETCREVLGGLACAVRPLSLPLKAWKPGGAHALCLLDAAALVGGKGRLLGRLRRSCPGISFLVLASAQQLPAIAKALQSPDCELLRRPLVRQELRLRALRALNRERDFEGRLFRSIVENMHGSLAIIDARLRILYANPQLGRLFHIPYARLAGWEVAKALRRVLDERSCEILLTRARQRIAGLKVPASYTIKTIYRKREVRWFKLRVVLLPSTGCGGRILAQFVDITEKLRALGALLKSERRYRSLVEAAPVGIVSVGRRGRILDVNRKLLEILGSPSTSAARNLELEALGFAGELEDCFQSGKTRVFENPFRSTLGKQGHLRVQLAPLRVKNGRVAQVQAIVEDISEQKTLEAAMEQAHKMDALATLTGGIAHEFNNLLQVIQGYAEMYRLERHDFEGLQEICQATQRAAELTSQLLTFGGLQEGERKPLDLNGEIRATVRLLQKSLLKRIRVELHLAEGLLPVAGDASQIRQMLTNIAVNAGEVLDERGLIRIQTLNHPLNNLSDPARPRMRPGPWALLRISDNGPGIAPADLKNVFDPFYTTKAAGQGVGLGLSVAYGIVKQHGGYIECSSVPGQGSSFDIYLPAAPGSDSPPG